MSSKSNIKKIKTISKTSKKKSKKKKVNIEDVYKKKTLHEHILSTPDTYIGTSTPDDVSMFIYNEEKNKIVEDVISYVAGFFKIFDEILVNARDHTVRDKTCKNISITMNKETGEISVWNDGNGIPVAMHNEENIYLPQMIFSNLLTSSNYDKKGKTVGGKNGYGSKLCLKKGTLIPTFSGETKKVEEIVNGEKLIGDDGLPRNVIDRREGNGRLFEIKQQSYEPYVVNEDHILCLRMPEHKVIFWSSTEKSWIMLWLDKKEIKIKKKSIRVYPKQKIECQECGEEMSSNLKRHYIRKHPGVNIPASPRKSPTTEAPDTQAVKNGKNKMEKFARTISDDNTLDISVKQYMKLNTTTKKRLSGYVGKCVQWKHKDIELDPYVLGLWLGDGGRNGRCFAINSEDDPEILEYLENWGLDNDARFKQEPNNKITFNISSLSKCRVAPLKKQLSKYNLVKNKHIPREYLVNSRDVRLKVLAGLIDSDGYVSRNGTRINIAQGMNHKRLIKDIIFLARSLGLMCCSKKVKTQWTYKGEKRQGEAININISGEDIKDIPTKVARKKCNSPVKRDTTGTGKLTVTEVDKGDFVGLAIDGNQRFVLNNFTVTHNCNIYSKRFEVHTIGLDKIKSKKSKKIEYTQVFEDNMYKINEPIINHNINQNSKTFTKITFSPDYERFGMKGLTNDMFNLLYKRCYDVAACTPKSVKIRVNGKEIKCREFKDYIKMYYQDNDTDGNKISKPKIAYRKVNSRWEIGIGFNKDVGDRYISFVNGISTFQGGTHVSHVVNNIVSKVSEHIKKKKEFKDLRILPSTIKQYLTFFINSTIEDPGFNSQTKEYMNSKMSDWCTCGKNCKDVKCTLTDDFIEELCNIGLLTEVIKMSQFKETRALDKTDGKKVGSLKKIDKLIDAEWAGTRKSQKTCLFLTEGDSARAFAVSGISVIGNQQYGVFPLKGKLLNVRKATIDQIKNNKEFVNIKAILGLKQGMKYKDVSQLRYGSVIILTDQDPDGSHIKGLVINMFEYFWPELLQIDGFIKAYNTPIVKAWKNTDKTKKNVKEFYTLTEFNNWVKTKLKGNLKGWNTKYYKGLGTSTDKEARESFNNFISNIVTFNWEKNVEDVNDNVDNDNDNNDKIKKLKQIFKKEKKQKRSKINNSDKSSDSSENSEIDNTINEEQKENEENEEDEFEYLKSKSHMAIAKAFDDRAIKRKEWLRKFRYEDLLEYKANMNVSYSDFIDRDLIYFSNLSNIRGIPSAIDGLKPSQRMILYCCFKRGTRSKEVRVAQLAGYVSENTDYHHGEESLKKAIIGLAQDFPGSNNINILKPNGNFGYRRQGGKEAASPRYIHTQMSPITPYIFREEDQEVLDYNYCDEKRAEPKVYYPIIPMALINGGQGIGTGYSTWIPPHNPKDIVKNLKRRLKDKPFNEMLPWYNGFKGTIEKNTKDKDNNKYIVKGKYNIDGNKVHIEDIPIVNGWIEPYENSMEKKVSVHKDDNKKINNIKNNPGNNLIDMTLVFKGSELQKLYKDNNLEKFLSMSQNISTTNLHLFDREEKLNKYDKVEDIFEEYYKARLKMYDIRKEFYLEKLKNELDIYKYKVKFIKDYLSGKLLIAKKKVVEVIKQLEDMKFPQLANDHRALDKDKSYRYLTDMTILTLTDDKIKELEAKMKQCKMIYEEYLNTPVKNIWDKELDEFLKEYEKWIKEWENQNIVANTKKEKVKNKRVRKVAKKTK
jgi:DNA topoisomerase-2